MAEQTEPVLHCPTCYSTKFQLSRIRPEERFQLLLLRHPVRCMKCNARVMASRSYANHLRKLGKVSPMDAVDAVDAKDAKDAIDEAKGDAIDEARDEARKNNKAGD